jgi:carbon storage regulator
MLVMQRREGESILIGDDIEIRILAVNGSRVKVGIEAPRRIPVLAREVHLVRAENIAASQLPAKGGAAMLAGLFRQGETRRQTASMSDKAEE